MEKPSEGKGAREVAGEKKTREKSPARTTYGSFCLYEKARRVPFGEGREGASEKVTCLRGSKHLPAEDGKKKENFQF